MSHDFDRLTKELQNTPAPDASRKAATLRAAAESFAQETAVQARPTSDRPEKVGLWKRIVPMFATPSMRPALYMTSCLVVAGLGFVLTQTTPPTPDVQMSEQEAVAVAEPMIEAMPLAAPAPVATAKRSMSAGVASLSADAVAVAAPPTRTYANAPQNDVQITSEAPVSTFSIDVDTASYAMVRQAILGGWGVDPNAVRTEEMVNYFTYGYTASNGPHPFSVDTALSISPWNEGQQILRIGLQGAAPDTRPPLDLVFLIDTSGSMGQPEKLPLLIQSLKLLLPQMGADDTIAIVTYAGSAGTALAPTPATDRATIEAALDTLLAGGGTAGAAGLEEAYRLAASGADDTRVGRVVLATDGDFNIGLSTTESLETYITRQRDSGTYLSVLGFGRGGFNDAIMQTLAQAGNGNAAYIDTLSEARRVLVDAFEAGLVPIADDVKVQVEFNPATVAEYRLIGYETRALSRTDFANDSVDAGEIGAGHQVTALYEITPVGSEARLSDPLRYATTSEAIGDELGFVKLRYKAPGAQESQLIETPVSATPAPADMDMNWAMAIAGWADLMRAGTPPKQKDMAPILALATAAKGPDPDGLRAEALTLMRTYTATLAQ